MRIPSNFLVGIAIFCFSLTVIGVIRFPILQDLQQSDQMEEHPTCNDIMACSNRTINYQVPYQDGYVRILSGTVNFTSENAFFVNHKINYQINITTAGSVRQIFSLNRSFYDYNQTYLVIASKNTNIDNYKKTQPQFLLNILPRNNTIIHLQISGYTLYSKGSFTTSNPDGLMIFAIIFGGSPYNVTISNSLGDAFKVETQTIGSDAILSHKTAISSLQITGMTYLGVVLLPTLLGADILLRVHFEDKESKEGKKPKDTRLDENPRYFAVG